MLKVVLLAILSIGLNSCHPIQDANVLYASLLPEGQPLFQITNGNALQKVIVYREGPEGLIFELKRRGPEFEILFNFNKRNYLLQAFKFRFYEEAAELDIIFEPQDKTGSPTNILITTTMSDKVEFQGDHGVTLEPITADVIQYLTGGSKPREKSTVLKVSWVEEYLNKKKPMFQDIRRGPATLVFIGPPMIINADIFAKLLELKDKIKSPFGEQFLTMVGSGKGLSGSRTPSRQNSLADQAGAEASATDPEIDEQGKKGAGKE